MKIGSDLAKYMSCLLALLMVTRAFTAQVQFCSHSPGYRGMKSEEAVVIKINGGGMVEGWEHGQDSPH